jgi:uncharacterized membrane protein
MAASFMATTAMLLVIGVLNLSEKIGTWSHDWTPLLLSYKASSELWQIKLGVLLLSFGSCFLIMRTIVLIIGLAIIDKAP